MSPLFFLCISFGIFLFFVYKKLKPILFEKIESYEDKILKQMLELEEQMLTLSKRLEDIEDDAKNINSSINQILDLAHEQAKKLSESSHKKLAEYLLERQNISHMNFRKIQIKHEKDFIMMISLDLRNALINWANQRRLDESFQNDSVRQSIFLLDKVNHV